jgi:16S rRNA (cytidine1402-2'-O)-methyltransferase
MAGTLFIVATPIGNLEDLTFRALRTLREVQLIAAEDTRRTSRLLAHYEIRVRLISLREHNEARETPRVLAMIEGGDSVAVVSDAGTPGISDPGALLVRAAHERGVKVVPIPGPSAVVAALSVSGFSGDIFTFLAFPPASGAARDRWFEDAAARDEILVFFESPHRINRTLEDARTKLAKRPIVVTRELTKVNEKLVASPKAQQPEIGEFAIVVGPVAADQTSRALRDEDVSRIVGLLTNELGSEDEVVGFVAKGFGVPPGKIRKSLKLARYARHQSQPEGDD